MMNIRQADDHDLTDAAGVDAEVAQAQQAETHDSFEEEQRKLVRAGKISKTMTVLMTYVTPCFAQIPLVFGQKWSIS